MGDTFFIVFVVIASILSILIRRELRKEKAKTQKTVKLSDVIKLKRREIKPLDVPKELLNQLLFAESDEQFKQVLEQHPELQRFDQVGVPMHEALNMLLMTGKETLEGDKGERIVMVSEMQPGVSSVVTETSDGKRIANMIQIPADTLSDIVLVTPEDLQLHVAHTLQIGLHHPEYLTEESYWMMGEIVASPKTNPDSRERIARLHKALGICLEYGLDQEWILKVREGQQQMYSS